MTISSVAAFSAASTSVALSGIQAGDLLIGVAYRNASATAASIPAGWIAIAGATGGGTTNALVAAYRIADGTETSSGTWANATQVAVSQYRSTGGANAWKVGAGAATGATSTSASIPALTLANPAASSWVFGAIGSKTDTTLASTAPTSMTRRTSVGTAGGLGVYDTAATVTSFAAKTKTVTSGAYRSVAVEFYEDTTPPTITSSNSGTVKGDGATAFSTTLTASEASTWAIVAGTNAAGFTLNAPTGVLSLPAQTYSTTGGSNARTVQVTATDAAGNTSAPTTFTLTVTDPSVIYRPWLPTDLDSALAAWWDAQQGVTQSAGSVTQWADVVSGLLATGSTGSQPTYSATGRNGTPALLFDGNSQNLSFNPATLPVADLFVGVAAFLNAGVSSGSWKRVFSYGADENNTSIQVLRRGDANAASELSAGTSALEWSGFDRFLEFSKSGTTGQVYADAQAASAPGTFGGNVSGTQGYIGRGLLYSDFWPGSVQQIVAINRVLTTDERQKLEGWESWYDGKAGANLPAGHPYKTAAPTVATGGGSGSQTGTLATSEQTDAASATVTATTAAALVITEPSDAAQSSAATSTATALTSSEAADTASGFVSVSTAVAVAATEGQDTAAANGQIATAAVLTAGEAGDAASFSSAAIVTATLGATEPRDSAGATSQASAGASLAASEPSDAATVPALASTAASLAASEPADTAAAGLSISTAATFAAAELSDTAAGSAVTSAAAALVATEPADGASIGAGGAASVALAATEAGDIASASGQVSTSATLTAGEPRDTAYLIQDIGAPVSASLTTTEGNDGASAAAVAATGAALAAGEGQDAHAAAASVTTGAQLVGIETADAAALVTAAASTAALASAEPYDSTAVSLTAGATAGIAAAESADQTTIAASLRTVGSLGAAEAPDAVQASTYAIAIAALAVGEPIDIAAATGVLSVVGAAVAQLAVTEPQDNVATTVRLYGLPDVILTGRLPGPASLTGQLPAPATLFGALPIPASLIGRLPH